MTGVGLLLMSGIQPGSEWTTLLGGFLVAAAPLLRGGHEPHAVRVRTLLHGTVVAGADGWVPWRVVATA
jgi:hypothetical protein